MTRQALPRISIDSVLIYIMCVILIITIVAFAILKVKATFTDSFDNTEYSRPTWYEETTTVSTTTCEESEDDE